MLQRYSSSLLATIASCHDGPLPQRRPLSLSLSLGLTGTAEGGFTYLKSHPDHIDRRGNLETSDFAECDMLWTRWIHFN